MALSATIYSYNLSPFQLRMLKKIEKFGIDKAKSLDLGNNSFASFVVQSEEFGMLYSKKENLFTFHLRCYVFRIRNFVLF